MRKSCATSLSSMRIGIICGMVQFTKRFGTMADRTLGRVTVRHAAAAAVGVAPGAGGVGYGTAVEEFGSPAIGFTGNERTCSPRVLQRTSRAAVIKPQGDKRNAGRFRDNPTRNAHSYTAGRIPVDLLQSNFIKRVVS